MTDTLLTIYLHLECLMFEQEEVNGQAADAILDLMDMLWYNLSEEQRDYLDGRPVSECAAETPSTP